MLALGVRRVLISAHRHLEHPALISIKPRKSQGLWASQRGQSPSPEVPPFAQIPQHPHAGGSTFWTQQFIASGATIFPPTSIKSSVDPNTHRTSRHPNPQPLPLPHGPRACSRVPCTSTHSYCTHGQTHPLVITHTDALHWKARASSIPTPNPYP